VRFWKLPRYPFTPRALAPSIAAELARRLDRQHQEARTQRAQAWRAVRAQLRQHPEAAAVRHHWNAAGRRLPGTPADLAALLRAWNRTPPRP
jgi:hypothetical protein